MGKLLLVIHFILFILLVAVGIGAYAVVEESATSTSARKTAEALERIANVLENPHCICPQATQDASEVSDAED